MKIKELTEDNQQRARRICQEASITWDLEMEVADLAALSKAYAEDERALSELMLRVADAEKELSRIINEHLEPTMRQYMNDLPFVQLLYFVKPREQQERGWQLKAQIEADTCTLNRRDPERRAALLRAGLDPQRPYVPIPRGITQ